MSNLRKARLIMVTGQNNNKFYNMDENADGTFNIEFGRVGTSGQRTSKPSSQWDKTLNSKTKKGYKDVSAIVMEVVTDAVAFAGISDDHIQMLLDKLQAYQHGVVTTNYQVGAGSVTKAQVAEAQIIIDQLAGEVDVVEYNNQLLELFQIIPRKMSKVNDYLIHAHWPKNEYLEEMNKKVQTEQDLLDTMASQVVQSNLAKENVDDSRTLLDAMGVTIERATLEDCTRIKDELGDISDKFNTAYKVTNVRTQKMFDDYVEKAANKKTILYFHGSRNENWLSIIKSGLQLRPTTAVISGKMFGYGTYFADKARKSYGYTSGRGSYYAGGSASEAIMALYDVHVGNQKILSSSNSSLSRKTLDAKYDSVFAEAGRGFLQNNEYIVYEEAQSTIKYLVMLRG